MYQVAPGIYTTFFLKDDKIYYCGKNFFNINEESHLVRPLLLPHMPKIIRKIGISDTRLVILTGSNDIHIYKGKKITHCLLQSKITDIFCAPHHVFYLTAKGEAYFINFQLHNRSLGKFGSKNGKSFTHISIEEKVSQIATCTTHTLFLTTKNNLYGLGSNRHGQLCAQRYLNGDIKQKLNLDIDGKIEQISVKSNCSYILTNKNKVYLLGLCWFCCSNCNLHKHRKSRTIIFSTNTEKILKISAGLNHLLILTDHGVFAGGSNEYGQLGIENVKHCLPQEIKLLNNKKIIAVYTEAWSSFFITKDGELYSCGWGVEGQLGREIEKNHCWKPTLINFHFDLNKKFQKNMLNNKNYYDIAIKHA